MFLLACNLTKNNVKFLSVEKSTCKQRGFFDYQNYIKKGKWKQREFLDHPNSLHYFIMKKPNKQELQQITFSHSSNIDAQCFMSLYKKCIARPSNLLAIDTTLA